MLEDKNKEDSPDGADGFNKLDGAMNFANSITGFGPV